MRFFNIKKTKIYIVLKLFSYKKENLAEFLNLNFFKEILIEKKSYLGKKISFKIS